MRQRGIDVCVPDATRLSEITLIIRGLIAGEEPSKLRSRLTSLAVRLEAEGVDCILLGCTELPIIGVDVSLPTINSLNVLASKLIEKHSASKVL